VSFTRRYFASILILPAFVSLPLGWLFLTQVEQMSLTQWALVLAVGIGIYAAGVIFFIRWLAPYVRDVEEALATREDLSEELSRCLRRTTRGTNTLWIATGVAFVLAATPISGHAGSLQHFAIAALLAAGLAMAWSYGVAKHILGGIASSSTHARYVGRHRLTVARKIALLFIGFFVISSLATVQLVSNRVARTLEALAISSATDDFDTIHAAAEAGAPIADLQGAVPPGHSVFRIERDGSVTSPAGVELRSEDVDTIRRVRGGDSTGFYSPDVMLFRELSDHSIIGLSVPWTPYSRIPLQITLYTLVTAVITTLLFIVATLWLSRDIRQPLRELRRVAAELAGGNFTVERKIFADDDIGELADSFGETRDNLRRLMGRIGGSGSVITQGVHVITGGTGALVARSRDQARLTSESDLVIDNFRSGIDQLVGSARKVSEATHDTSSRSLELQASAEEIARNMDHLFQSVEKTSSSTTEMNASAVEMSQRAQVLANIGEDVLSFAAEMDSTVEELRQNSEATADISSEVRVAAVSGASAVHQAVEGIDLSQKLTQESATVLDQLQASISEVDQILSVIEDVTEQTNLLALNASIIAAQAGEHGRSFNVVAGEIRQLAERTKGSTRQIGGIIAAVRGNASDAARAMQASVSRANENVTLARGASESLQLILSSADRSHDMAARISRALTDQAQASRHLHEVTSRMTDHIAEINRSTTEQARGTQLLAEEAEKVREIALQVRTSTDQQSVASRGITAAMEQMAADAALIHDLLERQLVETERIANASKAMLQIARDNEGVAQDFNRTVETLVRSGDEFESEVGRFRL
jgi:methyl-accepting chemotaxis protein